VENDTVPVAGLRAAGFGDEVENVATAVAGYLDDGAGGNVAVISEPYAGRDSLLAYAASLLEEDATWIDLDPSAADGTGPPLPGDEDYVDPTDDETSDDETPDATDDGGDAPGAGAVIVANCHYLFERRIDGFEALDAFLDRIALSDALVITSWNRYAWSYLDAVRDVGDSFTTQVEIPRLDADEISAVIEGHYGPDLPDVIDAGRAGRVKTVVFDRHPVALPRGRSVGIPYPKPNTAWVASWSIAGDEESVEAVLYEKLRRVSNGNPGVAIATWDESVRDGEIAPGYVEAFTADIDLDTDAAVLLWTVISMERVDIDRVAAAWSDRPVETSLQHLVERDLVTVDGSAVSIRPEALHVAIGALERRGLLW